jgi:hypothetical protein
VENRSIRSLSARIEIVAIQGNAMTFLSLDVHRHAIIRRCTNAGAVSPAIDRGTANGRFAPIKIMVLKWFAY